MFELVQVFYDPGAVFEKVRERGIWLWAMIAIIILSLIGVGAIVQLVGVEAMLRKQQEMNPQQTAQPITPQVISIVTWSMWGVAVLANPIILLVLAAVLLGLMSLLGGQIKFKQSLGTACYAWFPYSLVMTLMSTLILKFSPDAASMDMRNLVPLNLGPFLDRATTGKFLYSLAGSLDLASFALMGLLAFGYSKVCRLSFGKCFFAVLALWVVYVLAKSGLSMLGS